MANYGSGWERRMIRMGILTLVLAIIANFGPPLYLWLGLGVIPPFEDILKIWAVAAAAFGIGWVIQPVSFFSILGTTSSYISWFAGSVADIRVPAVTMAQRVTGVEPGTPEGEVITTIAVAASVLVSVTVITVFTFIGAAVVPLLPKFIHRAFDFVLPAVFGGVYTEMASKHLTVGMATAVAAIVLTIGCQALKLPPWAVTIVTITCGIIVARIYYKHQTKGERKASA